MVREETEALLKTAHDQLIRAEDDYKRGFYDACALFSALAAENAASALILALGSKPSKRHRNWYVLQLLPTPKAAEKTMHSVLERLKLLEDHRIRARYPIKDEEGNFRIPSEYYDKPKSGKLLDNTEKLIEEVEASIRARTRRRE